MRRSPLVAGALAGERDRNRGGGGKDMRRRGSAIA